MPVVSSTLPLLNQDLKSQGRAFDWPGFRGALTGWLLSGREEVTIDYLISRLEDKHLDLPPFYHLTVYLICRSWVPVSINTRQG
jgi:hypothetical protein